MEGRIADAENAKQQAAKLQQSLQQQQRDLDKERTVLARHAAELETAKAQVLVGSNIKIVDIQVIA